MGNRNADVRLGYVIRGSYRSLLAALTGPWGRRLVYLGLHESWIVSP